MIIVSVQLLSARDGSTQELARAYISNEGGDATLGDYGVEILRGRSSEDFARRTVLKRGKVLRHPRQREHVWNLVAKALSGLGYGIGRK
ncbi:MULTISPECIES: hypothetical protein [unclassified Sphingomonas]|uniref:hypothetical protein n=1 Tax=unclassified Sphingomonas TaxID=196159 RepID=UPI0006FE9C74|nr:MULTISPECIES: hypothetical protein [unclassified Sphingomonas]KQX19367.1 hypothetical protein ASD17_12560 [Sphingomonas sp. Root1294]KQY65570.1 hypothetical protein ASD39_15760 [Sphingomonas sp. Root50]KRB95129.1 hypothetical protein ASE22_04295 [Sphingomonas sp. Root720]